MSGSTIRLTAISFLGLVILLLSTQPAELPTPLLILPFLFIFSCVLFLISTLLRAKGLTKGRSIRVGSLCAGLLILLLGMQTVGQLGVRDIIMLGVLFGVIYMYMSRVVGWGR